jgi:FG-GAP-like repeat
MTLISRLLVLTMFMLFFAAPVNAVIKVDLPVSKRYDLSKAVCVGKVTAVNAGQHVVDVALTQTLKGAPGPQQFRVQLTAATANAIAAVKVGQPVVVLVDTPAVVHIADTWFRAMPVANSQPPLWRVNQVDPTGHKDFPGTTATLVRVIEEIKAGKPTLLNAWESKPFQGGTKEVAKLAVSKPTFMLAVDVNGDKKPDLLVGTAAGVKLFLASGDGYEDATEKWGLTGATGAAAAAGDVNGDKPALLIGKTLYINDGQKFSAAKAPLEVPDGVAIVAEALADATDHKKPDATVLLSDGRLLTFENPGAPGQPWPKKQEKMLTSQGTAPLAAAFADWASNGKLSVLIATDATITLYPVNGDDSPIDFERLVGEPISSVKAFDKGLKNPAFTTLDINGDKRPDLLITADGGVASLVNRGFGAFLSDPDAGADLTAERGLSVNISATRARAAVDTRGDGTNDLLVLADDGRLFLVSNPPAKAKP